MIKPLAGSLLDPDHPEARGLAILSVLFFITLWIILLTSRQVLHGHWFDGIDSYIFHSLQNLRTPWVHSTMVFITQFGNLALLAIVLAGSCCVAVLETLHQGRLALAGRLYSDRPADLGAEKYGTGRHARSTSRRVFRFPVHTPA